MEKKIIFSILYCLIVYAAIAGFTLSKNDKHTIDLSGEWNFQIDSLDVGTKQQWFAGRLNDKIKLPGSMLTNGKGNEVTVNTKWTGGIWDSTWYKKPEFSKYRQPGNTKVTFWLQPLKHYVGVAWYQKQITIPSNWNSRNIQLFLERCHWETTLWVDNEEVGTQNALGTPHIYHLGNKLKPGKHTITLRIDNSIKEIQPGNDAHSISDNTQTNWNGIIGRICLESKPAVFISEVQLYPDIDKKLVKAKITLQNITSDNVSVQLRLAARTINVQNEIRVKPLNKKITAHKGSTVVIVDYPMGSNVQLWDEFHPDLYALNVSLSGSAGIDQKTVEFGMRKLATKDRQFLINGRPVFYRGTLECAIFPKTGYPPTTEDEWMRIYRICKNYGLNHIRFHSWCPPEAAFRAADRIGFYLMVENATWTAVGDGKAIDQFIYDESERMVSCFGNHPSFCMMAHGNEPSGDNHVSFLAKYVAYWKEKENRILITAGSNYPAIPENDFNSTAQPRIQLWAVGLNSIINSKPPQTAYNWDTTIAQISLPNQPTISHEIGQWCVYPNFKEMKKYTSVLKPRNFEVFKEQLEKNGMAHLADSFLWASGKLQVLLYKADIEAAFRSQLGGFQLLDLHDFPGQGTALVGVLDAFWDEKGYVTHEEYRRFCNSTVPLLRLPKMIYLNNEILSGKVEMVHYGEKEMYNLTPVWKITHSDGTLFSKGKLASSTVTFGNTSLGTITQNFSSITKPEQLTITVKLGAFENSWHVWVYPAQLPSIDNEHKIRVTQKFGQQTEDYLQKGGTVLLTLPKGSVKQNKGGDVAIGFSSIFWNTQWTEWKQPPFTLGILCNPKHPALARFPTEYHSNYQWWDAMSHSSAIRLDSVSTQLQPIVRVIDDWFTAKPLGLIFECKVGKGKLLVSGIDLLDKQEDRKEARQLLHSLKNYMVSKDFNPVVEVTAEKIRSLIELHLDQKVSLR